MAAGTRPVVISLRAVEANAPACVADGCTLRCMDGRSREEAVQVRAEALRRRWREESQADQALARRGRELALAVDQVADAYLRASEPIGGTGQGRDGAAQSAALWVYETVVAAATATWDDLIRDQHARRLTQVLAAAAVLPEGARALDVGRIPALQFRPAGAGCYWATTDLVDDAGISHLEITVARSSTRPALTAADLTERGGTCTEETMPGGTSLTKYTWESGGHVQYHLVMTTADGDYIDAWTDNSGSRSSEPERERPVVDFDALIGIATIPGLRP